MTKKSGKKELFQKIDALISERSSLRSIIERLEHLANYDELTGLPNRRSFMKSFHESLKNSRARGLPLSFCILDIDHFKKVNDRHGHTTGDVVLVSVAQILRNHEREGYLYGRIGGEEFAIVLTQTPLRESVTYLEKLRRAIKRHSHVCASKKIIKVTSSFGVVEMRTEDDVKTLLARADKALYMAKHSGRDKVCSATT